MINRSAINPSNDDFFITAAYRQFAVFCDACRQNRRIGLCYGIPGLGKTVSAKYYASWHIIDSLTIGGWMSLRNPRLPSRIAQCRTIFYTPGVDTTPTEVDMRIAFLQAKLKYAVLHTSKAELGSVKYPNEDFAELIIVDEAQRLNNKALKKLLQIFDRSEVLSLILVGIPDIREHVAHCPEFHFSLNEPFQFGTITLQEMPTILAKQWNDLGVGFDPNDSEIQHLIGFIADITRCNFRLIKRLFQQIKRVLRINQLDTIDKDVILTARELLIFGNE